MPALNAERRKPLTRFASVSLALLSGLAAIVAILAYVSDEKPEKQLTIYIEADIELAPRGEGAAKQLTVAYKGIQLKEPRQVRIKLKNDGNVSISDKDVETPLALEFSPASIVTVTTSTLSPPDLSADCIQKAPESVYIHHKLMNPGDSLVCDIILDGKPDTFKITGRISGLSSPTLSLPPEPAGGKYALGLPESLLLALLILATAGAAIGMLVSLFLALEMLDLDWNEIEKAGIAQRITAENMQGKIQAKMTEHDNVIVSSAAPYFRQEWIGDSKSILGDLERIAASPLSNAILQDVARAAASIGSHLDTIIRLARIELIAETIGGGFHVAQTQFAASEAQRRYRQQTHVSFASLLETTIQGLTAASKKPSLIKRVYLSFGVEDWIGVFLAISAAAAIVILIEFWSFYLR
ncbi:MAG: hypothetical protein IPO88_10780 [Nannocystis sp.]|uniref:hypothetical protein n=1 Tax=Nannocystis sp. TaxID=1962667 RepID=UPI002424CC23|nr:hypothetical protein [Nannocystis sp.]MBK9753973.1 hypothetical protein [Nannocystis sp.]